MKKDSISHTLATAVAGGGRSPAFSRWRPPAAKRMTRPGVQSAQPDRGFGCTDRRQGTGGARPLRAERLSPVVSDPSLRSLAKPGSRALAVDEGEWGNRCSRPLTFAPSGRPASSSPKHGRDASTFFFLSCWTASPNSIGTPLLALATPHPMSAPVKTRRHLQLVPISELGACDPSGRRIQVARDPRAPRQVRDGVETWIETQRQHPNLILTSSGSPPQIRMPAVNDGKEAFFLVAVITMPTPATIAFSFPISAAADGELTPRAL